MKQNKFIYSITFGLLLCVFGCKTVFNTAKSKCAVEPVRIAFYNVENLFDTEDNPLTKDEEFTPTSDKEYTLDRYHKKLNSLNKVISSLGNGKAPSIIGLSEVENKNVLEDLLKESAFNHSKFGIIHQESQDFRGIDCALLYDKSVVEIKSSTFLTPTFPDEAEPYTSRDVVVAELLINNCDRIYAFVNHWPSRYGGKAKSEPRRLRVAKMVKEKINEIYAKDQDAKIVLMGDFNDEPFDKSCKDIIGACLKTEEVKENDFVSLFGQRVDIEDFGSYNYRGNWNILDQFMVSEDFYTAKKGYKALPEKANILKEDYMLYYDKKYKYKKPSRTYGGPNYYGGYSDHLPIYLDLIPN